MKISSDFGPGGSNGWRCSENWVKLNTDASFLGDNQPGGAGMIKKSIPHCIDKEDVEEKSALIHWRTFLEAKRAMAPPTQWKFTQYHLLFTFFNHVKHKIFQIGPLNCHVITFSPSYNNGQGPPLPSLASDCSKAWVTTISYWSLSAPAPQDHQNDFSWQIQTVEHLRCDQGLAQSLSWLSQHCVNFGEKRM
jgi:hypothetical protein